MDNEKIKKALEEAGALFPPCRIGDTIYAVGSLDGEPYIEAYTAEMIAWDGERWLIYDDGGLFNEIGTDEAILDHEEALARFRELRDEYINGGSDGSA